MMRRDDHQVRARIVVAQCEIESGVVDGGRCAAEERDSEDGATEPPAIARSAGIRRLYLRDCRGA